MSKEFNQQAGRIRHRIEIQRKEVLGQDEIGGEIVVWKKLKTRWGSLRPVTGREIEAADQVDAIISHEIRMRYFPGLRPVDRLIVKSMIYNLVSVRNVDQRKKMYAIMALRDTQVEYFCLGNENLTCILQENGEPILLE